MIRDWSEVKCDHIGREKKKDLDAVLEHQTMLLNADSPQPGTDYICVGWCVRARGYPVDII